MKARLVYYKDQYRLLLHTGKILMMTADDVCEFLLNFDSSKYYEGSGEWDYEGVTMESHEGETVAYVDDDGTLLVKSAPYVRNAFSQKKVNYLTVPEFAELHGRKTAIVRRRCCEGRITGALQKGKKWLIPADAPYPDDERLRG